MATRSCRGAPICPVAGGSSAGDWRTSARPRSSRAGSLGARARPSSLRSPRSPVTNWRGSTRIISSLQASAPFQNAYCLWLRMPMRACPVPAPGKHPGAPADAALAQALAEVLVEIAAGWLRRRDARHRAGCRSPGRSGPCRARLESRQFALVDLHPVGHSGTLDIVAPAGSGAGRPRSRESSNGGLARPVAARCWASSWSLRHSAGT